MPCYLLIKVDLTVIASETRLGIDTKIDLLKTQHGAVEASSAGWMAQYQHYIPQFLLRNFSHPYKPLVGKTSREGGKRRYEKGKHKGDKVLDVLDLLIQSTISSCSITDGTRGLFPPAADDDISRTLLSSRCMLSARSTFSCL
jgi:hypothetical protein